MNNEKTWSKVQSIFHDAMGVPAADRDQYVLERCDSDDTLIHEVRTLLEAFDGAEEALETGPVLAASAAGLSADKDELNELAGYELLDEIHRGGQGVVYRAIQRSTYRIVAIKVLLHAAFASEDAKRRFEREVKVVANLQHPGIVPIFDSGLMLGQYFFAMEYVEGVPLDFHADENELSTSEKLELFAQVCDAIAYAHQRGVIHRDLKPSNILVDLNGNARVLDFGLAKPGSSQDDSLALSLTGQVMGTMGYMSPEQASGRPGEVDERSDVYSLGVLLYRLLTKRLPYVLDSSLLENLATIKSVAPNRLLLRDHGVDETLSTILLTALQKNKERRYDSASAFVSDVRRYLIGQSVEAKQDRISYLIGNSVKRNLARWIVAVVLVVVLFVSIYTINLPASPKLIAEPLPPLAAGEQYSQLDLETQLDAIRDLIRSGQSDADVVSSFQQRFASLRPDAFVDAMSEQRKADLAAMTEIANFIAHSPTSEEIEQRVRQLQESQSMGSTITSGLADELAAQTLARALALSRKPNSTQATDNQIENHHAIEP